LRLAAIPAREDPHDVLLAARPLEWRESSGKGPRIGTSSLRRRAQLFRINPRLCIEALRGNVPTRLQKALDGQVDAIVLARAGIHRLGLAAPHVEELSFGDMLPAPGQGALGLEIRADDEALGQWLSQLNAPAAERACRAEREFLHALGGGCRVPIAALGHVIEERLILDGLVISEDGARCIRDRIEGPAEDPEGLGRRLAALLLSRGAGELLALPGPKPPVDLSLQTEAAAADPTPVSMECPPLAGRRVVVTRHEDIDGPLSRALLARGAEVRILSLVGHCPPRDPEPLRRAAGAMDSYDWLIFTSSRAVEAFGEALVARGRSLAEYAGKIACVGPSTARRVEAAGGRVRLEPGEALGEALAEALEQAARRGELVAGMRVLFPRAESGGRIVAETLRRLGAQPDEVVAYRTLRHAESCDELAEAMDSGVCDAILLASASAAQTLLDELGVARLGEYPRRGVLACIGPATSAPLRRVGITPQVEAEEHTFEGLAQALADYYASRRCLP
jgi:hydroxymethylbilane synthase